MSDLVEHLRDRMVCSLAHNSCRNDLICEQAAARIEELEARLATARNDALEEAAEASEMWTCAKCGAIFHPKKNPHTDADCAVGHSAWDGPISSDEVTAAIRAMKSTTQP